MAISAGPLDPFNHAVSFIVTCDDQAEIDRYWNALLAGGSAEQCGWLKDRFGLSWQIVPAVLGEMMTNPDRAKAKRAADAMLRMVRRPPLCIQQLEDGTGCGRDRRIHRTPRHVASGLTVLPGSEAEL